MAARKRTKKIPPVPPLETFTTRLPIGLHMRLKVAAAHHKVSVQALVQRGCEMALGDL